MSCSRPPEFSRRQETVQMKVQLKQNRFMKRKHIVYSKNIDVSDQNVNGLQMDYKISGSVICL